MNTVNMPGFNAEASCTWHAIFIVLLMQLLRTLHHPGSFRSNVDWLPGGMSAPAAVLPPGWRCCGSCDSGQCDDVCVRLGQSCP